MKDLEARDKLATRKKMNSFDRVENGDNSCFYSPRSLQPTPEEFAANLWSEVNALKDAISMPAGTRPWQKTMAFVDGFQRKLPDEELAVIKRYVEKRSREAARVTVMPVSTAQHCLPRPLNPEIPSDVHVNMEEKDKGRMEPERDELESSSAGTGLETPGQQCHPIWETGRTTADGFLTAGVDSNQGGDISSPTERVDTRAVRTTTPISAASNINFQQQGHKPKDKDKDSEENKQFDLGVEEEKPPPWNAAVMVGFSFPEKNARPGVPVFLLRVLCLCVSVCLLCSLFIVPFIRRSLFIELKCMRGDVGQATDVRNRRASIFLPINPLKIIPTVSSSAVSKCLGNRIYFIWFVSFASRFFLVAILC